MKKVYAALVIAAALATCLEIVLGFTAAIAIPSVFFAQFGNEFGLFMVNVLTLTVPYFLVSMVLLPLLGYIAKVETFRYAFVTLIGFGIIVVWRWGGLTHMGTNYSQFIPFIAGLCSILLAGWIVDKRYVSSQL